MSKYEDIKELAKDLSYLDNNPATYDNYEISAQYLIEECGWHMKRQAELKTSDSCIPETLDWCKKHYTPPVTEHIHCPDFGKCDGTNGGCWWCMEMTPYQWHMCSDETWVRGLLSPVARIPSKNRTEAAAFIEDYKQRDIIEETET
jgi:hypothetical protein